MDILKGKKGYRRIRRALLITNRESGCKPDRDMLEIVDDLQQFSSVEQRVVRVQELAILADHKICRRLFLVAFFCRRACICRQ